MSSRRRTTPARPLRVAGRHQAVTGGTTTADPVPPDEHSRPRPRGRHGVGTVARQPASTPRRDATAAELYGEREERSGIRSPIAALVALLAVVVIASGLAVWFRGEAEQLRNRAGNDALVDVVGTAQVLSHVDEALEAVYSYDFARLDENERTARELITEGFSDDYRMLFEEVRQLAPDQPAVVSAVVANSAVRLLDGDRAIVVAFIDQQTTRGVDTEQFAVPARLTVTAERVDDRWKIAAIEIV